MQFGCVFSYSGICRFICFYFTPAILNLQRMEKRRCISCGAEISGRSDKKFCSDLCRHEWHNSNHRRERIQAERINAVLLKNRRILRSILDSGKVTITVERLTYMQFNFNAYTFVRRRTLRPTLYFCYDICYYTSLSGTVHILDPPPPTTSITFKTTGR